uniref:Uncharacterized protein n=1 Tax=Rhizophora mucronata TaxID=61149 RepID=A0A2P2N233_RHIMU
MFIVVDLASLLLFSTVENLVLSVHHAHSLLIT